ncbi:MAG: MoaD/ThiS family protein [Phycisphaerales bacterium]|nr:MoaD/ThiS family protein [Phycisphaerales bacterium]
MRITVKLFGPEARSVGAAEVAVDVPGETPTCADVLGELARTQPALAATVLHCRLAVNCEFAQAERILTEQDEIALIGMVAGG